MQALLQTHIRNKICHSEPPPVVARLCIQRQDAGTGVRILSPVTPRFNCHGPHSIDINFGSKVPARGIVDLEPIK